MALVPLFDEVNQFNDYNGTVLAAGKLYVYHLGRTRLADIYSDIDGTVLQNPVTLDNLGRGPIYVSQDFNYTLVVMDEYGQEMFSQDKFIYSQGGPHNSANVAVGASEYIAVSSTQIGDTTVYTPYLTGDIPGPGSGGKTYHGIDPIVVNNIEDKISANTVPFGVQEPLYFVEDETATIIGLSGNPSADAVNWVTAQGYLQRPDLIGYATTDFVESAVSGKLDKSAFATVSGSFLTALPEGTMNESGFEYDGTAITGYDGSAFKAGDEFPQSATEAVELVTSNSASWNDVSGKLDESAFSSVSGDFLTAHQSLTGSANWDSTYNTVHDNSASWTGNEFPQSAKEAIETVTANSAYWDGAYTAVDSNSGAWSETYGAVNSMSAEWTSAFTSVNQGSGAWDSAWAAIYGPDASANLWNQASTAVTAGSSYWDETYFTVSQNSASWNGTGSCLWTANPDDSFMGGISGVSANNSALSMGTDNTATHSAIAIGLARNSAHNEAVAIGVSNTAGWYGVSLGMKNFASTDGISIGTQNSGNAETYAIGYRNSGKPNAMMFGYKNTADGTAIGYQNKVTGGGVALAYEGRMSGHGLALGRYNLRSADSILVIGNGTSDAARSDVLFIDNSGGLSALGKISANGVELGAGGASYTGDVQLALDEIYNQSAIWNTVGDKLDTTATGNFYLTSNPSGFITDSDIANKLDTTAFSTVSGSFLTAIPSDVVTTGDLTASSNWDSTYNTVYTYSSTWTGGGTARPVLPVTGVSGIQVQESGDQIVFSYTGNTVPAGVLVESGLEYDSDNKISGYSGSAFAAGASYTGDAQGALDEVYSNSADWNSAAAMNELPVSAGEGIDIQNVDGNIVFSCTGGSVPEGVLVESGLEYNAANEISGYSGSAFAQYGADKQWLVHDDTLLHEANSAQYALGVNVSAVAQLMGVDETVLWSGNLSAVDNASLTASEDPLNFEFLDIYMNGFNDGLRATQVFRFVSTNKEYCLAPQAFQGLTQRLNHVRFQFNGTIGTCSSTIQYLVDTNGIRTASDRPGIIKIVGIGRKGV